MKKKHIILGLIVVVISISAALKDNFFEISKNIDIFTSLYKEINLYYVDQIEPGKIIKTGIDAMLNSLDPYTVYYPESEIEDVKFMTTGQYGGIGALIKKKNDKIIINEVYNGFPAFKSGLKPGDLLISIDGKSTKNLTTQNVSELLKGPSNTTIKVEIQHYGESKIQEIDITREEIKIPNIPYNGFIDNGIAYLNFSSFTQNSGAEIKEALIRLKEETDSLKGLVLDLRGNPGGLLHEAVNICNLFIDKNLEVVSTKGKLSKWDKSYNTTSTPFFKNLPLVILVNSHSASASEIVSGALQDYDRAVIIGERTFGKGLVQNIRPLSYNAQVKITTAKYYIPSGRCIQALDYFHRNANGSVGKIPDSLISEFKTKNGRIVYDGGGVMPDIKIENQEATSLVYNLLKEDKIFEFALKFKSENETIETPKDFNISDKIYNDFINFIKTDSFSYKNDSENALQEFIKTAEQEKNIYDIQENINEIKRKLNSIKEDEFENNSETIKRLLKSQILNIYYNTEGQISGVLKDEPEIIKAIELLNNPEDYFNILNNIELYNKNVKIK